MTLNLLVAALATTPYLAPQIPLPEPAPTKPVAFYQPALQQTYDLRALLELPRERRS